MVEIYNEVVHDLLSADVKRQVELQKTATGFDIPAITTVGASRVQHQFRDQVNVACVAIRCRPTQAPPPSPP